MASSNLNFRLATEADASALGPLINTAFRNDNTTQVFLSADHTGVDVIDVPSIIAKINQPDCAVLAVTDSSNNSIVAHGSVRKVDDTCAWFGVLAVDVNRQREGLGGQVLAWVEQYAVREWGCSRMEFDVVNTRTDLIAWYNRRGYQPTGRTAPFPYKLHGDWEGVLRDDLCFIVLAKTIGATSAITSTE
ncbi:acyl-CoA N-acyltransferase [Astrocystis sublimbata]|nr:acyl-CoA N-acyltransferase [Astrocystis sublimbata]